MNSQTDIQLLVLVRPSEKQPTSGLEKRMHAFLQTGDGSENLDNKTFSSLHGTGQIADYLLWKRHFIAEMKAVNGYPAQRIERLIDEELRVEPRTLVFGQVGIQKLLSSRTNGTEINRMMVHIGGRPIRKLLQLANPQIADTRVKFGLPDATGLAIILIDEPQKIEASVAAYAVREALKASEPLLDEIDCVWVSLETHMVSLPGGRTGFPELVISRANRLAEIDRVLMGKMLDAWAAFNGTEMDYLDHSGGWETLNPIGDGWPLILNLPS